MQSKEAITNIFCKHEHPEIESHHDAILSEVNLPATELDLSMENLVTAPRLSHQRQKIVWSSEGILDYQELVSSQLHGVRTRWLNPISKTSASILLKMTNAILNNAAIKTNKSVNLN